MNQRQVSEPTEEQVIEIDRIADQFERDWREGKKPRIEKVLVGRDHIRRPLLEELLRVEREMQEREGHDATIDDYRSRFPEDRPAVDAAFSYDGEDAGDDELVDKFERVWTQVSSISAEAFALLSCPKPSRSIFLKLLEREAALRLKRFQDTEGDPESRSSADPGSQRGEPIPPYFGRYQVTRLISRGGFGEVYGAFDPKLERHVAIKTPRVDRLIDEAARAEFEREAKLICRLEHPHILPVYDYGMADSGRP